MADKRTNVQIAFNADFCSTLEYHLSGAFSNLGDDMLSTFWCDGIDKPLIYECFNESNITSINELTTCAWIGPKGHDKYRMIIKLGRRSRKRALKGLDLNICMPNSFNWVDIDVLNQVITIQLD